MKQNYGLGSITAEYSIFRSHEVLVENDGSKNPTTKCPQSSVDVAVKKAGSGIR